MLVEATGLELLLCLLCPVATEDFYGPVGEPDGAATFGLGFSESVGAAITLRAIVRRTRTVALAENSFC